MGWLEGGGLTGRGRGRVLDCGVVRPLRGGGGASAQILLTRPCNTTPQGALGRGGPSLSGSLGWLQVPLPMVKSKAGLICVHLKLRTLLDRVVHGEGVFGACAPHVYPPPPPDVPPAAAGCAAVLAA